jgi:hypothetical protein
MVRGQVSGTLYERLHGIPPVKRHYRPLSMRINLAREVGLGVGFDQRDLR